MESQKKTRPTLKPVGITAHKEVQPTQATITSAIFDLVMRPSAEPIANAAKMAANQAIQSGIPNPNRYQSMRGDTANYM